MPFAESIISGFRNVGRTTGRSARAEFAPFAIVIMTLWLANLAGRTAFWSISFPSPRFYESNLPTVSFILYLLLAAVSFSAIARRFHDIGYSTRWASAMYAAPLLAVLLPLVLTLVSTVISPPPDITDDGRGIGTAFVAAILFVAALAADLIIVIVLCFLPSQPSTNRYGPNPSEASK